MEKDQTKLRPKAKTSQVSVLIAQCLFVLACVHEFIWQWFPDDIQGDIRAITQWPLTAAMCLLIAILAKHRFISAACTAIVVMSATTSLCSMAWLYAPWSVELWTQQCSVQWGIPMLLVSVLAALLVLVLWTSEENG